jgi:2-aminomuconate deaminase
MSKTSASEWSKLVTNETLNSKTAGAVIHSNKAPEPVGHYPHARAVGNLLFLSGVGPRERGTKVIPGVELNADGTIAAYDIEKQCRSVFKNVRAILEDAGSSWENLVDVTVYLTNMKADFPTYNRLWAEHFPNNPPCRTTLEINALPTPIAIELKCIAVLDARKAVEAP